VPDAPALPDLPAWPFQPGYLRNAPDFFAAQLRKLKNIPVDKRCNKAFAGETNES